MKTIEVIGSILGYVISFFTLYALVKTKFLGLLGGFVKKESGSGENSKKILGITERLDNIEQSIHSFMEADKTLKENINWRLENQNDACRQLLAGMIEDTYYKNRDTKTLDSIALKRILNAYVIYHEELKGNSYISSIYDEMMEWERVD